MFILYASHIHVHTSYANRIHASHTRTPLTSIHPYLRLRESSARAQTHARPHMLPPPLPTHTQIETEKKVNLSLCNSAVTNKVIGLVSKGNSFVKCVGMFDGRAVLVPGQAKVTRFCGVSSLAWSDAFAHSGLEREAHSVSSVAECQG